MITIGIRRALAILTLAGGVAACAVLPGIASAGPPAAPVTVTLSCTGAATYSYIENVVLFAKTTQVSAPVSLECSNGANPFGVFKGYPTAISVPVTAKPTGWGWAGTWWCSNAAAPGGGGTVSVFASPTPFPKGKNAAARCPSPSSTNGSDVFLSFG